MRSLVDLGEIAACTTGLNMSESPFLVFNFIQTHYIYVHKSKSKLHAHLERPLSVRWSVLAIIRQTNPQSTVETQLLARIVKLQFDSMAMLRHRLSHA